MKINFSPAIKALDKKCNINLKASIGSMLAIIGIGMYALTINPKISLAICICFISTAFIPCIYGIYKFEKWIKERANLIEKESIEEKFDFLSKNKQEVELSLNSLYGK